MKPEADDENNEGDERRVLRSRFEAPSIRGPTVQTTLIPSVRKGENIQYDTKSNSKLRCLPLDRGLHTSGSRTEMISQLANTSIDYTTLPSQTLTEILRGRCGGNGAAMSKENKIAQVRHDDTLDVDSNNFAGGVLEGGSVNAAEERGCAVGGSALLQKVETDEAARRAEEEKPEQRRQQAQSCKLLPGIRMPNSREVVGICREEAG